ncbi:MAG: hypothetical protein PHZ26_02070 [Candidatus Gracilibacteria bacterium]|nr:hypothetical protein [Candidatus Gracilibacteria bacterium]MDD2908521.1 hypothetical protein [Candidatus Gracilibacteria bacterium]
MIKSYIEEIHSRRNKAAIFWLMVFISSCLLYLFFQGYYVNVDFKINDGVNPKNILKQFGIINIHVFPNPDNIFINGKSYSNSSKSIFDYGNYNVEVYSTGYVSSIFNVHLNKNYPIYYETINLFKKLKYKPILLEYDEIKKVDDYYLAFSKKDKQVQVINNNYNVIKTFINDYFYIGYKYFSNNGNILVYDFDTNILKPYISKTTGLEITCNNVRTYHDRLFCFDNMDFIDGSSMKGDEKVLRINNNIILTTNNIYNNGNGGDWGTYVHSNKYIYDPENLAHIDSMPFILEDGYLYNLENTKKTKLVLPEFDTIKNSYEFSKETMFLGYKGNVGTFLLIDEKNKFSGTLDDIDLSKVSVFKINGAYIFNTGNNLYLYYKGSTNLISILKGEDISVIGNDVFFKKDGKNYTLNLIQ